MIPVRKIIFPLSKKWGGVAATGQGLLALITDRESSEAVASELSSVLPRDGHETEELEGERFNEADLWQLVSELDAYFQGEVVSLDYPVDWAAAGVTDFQKKALEACQAIPYGERATYGDLAKAVGNPKASRAIGGAMHINPVSLVVP